MAAQKSIDKMSIPQLQAVLTEIEALIERKKHDERQELVARLKQEAKDAGFDISELFGAGKAKSGKGKIPPKYRCPTTGQTWSGRGRKPNWILAYAAEGHDIETFLI